MNDENEQAPPRADALVMFGASGDLARKKLFPALYHLEERDRLGDMPVVAVARSRWGDDALRGYAEDSLGLAGLNTDPQVWRRLRQRLHMVSGDYAAPETYQRLAELIEGTRHRAFYLAIPPSVFPDVIAELSASGLSKGARVVVEKPFGRDVPSAAELNRTLQEAFPESAILRIDHYLGKESVENLLVFRFANSFLEPVWDRDHIDHVQITMSESFGIEGRGTFYDTVGAFRDVVQNHLLQVVALLAMEPPQGADAEKLRDETSRVLAGMAPIDPSRVVRGQYEGYRDETGVHPRSATETYAAVELAIDSWRWAGVPFFVRAGKRLAVDAVEAIVQFRPPPRLLFTGADACAPEANLLRFRLSGREGVTLTVQAKEPGSRTVTRPIDLAADFDTALGRRRDAYERLLEDAIDGDARRFARVDGVEAAWRVVQPVLDAPGPLHRYGRGSWGPPAADEMIAASGRSWHQPFTSS